MPPDLAADRKALAAQLALERLLVVRQVLGHFVVLQTLGILAGYPTLRASPSPSVVVLVVTVEPIGTLSKKEQ